MGKTKNKRISISEMYCTSCGHRCLDIPRVGKMREPGHLKKLYCLNCEEQTNCVEIRPFGKYTYDDFLIEFENGNFTKDGKRIVKSYKQFEAFVRDEVWDKETQQVKPKKRG
jgi:hypothetical protein